MFFLNSDTGWVGGDAGLYQTDDGGRTWKNVPLKIPDGSYVSKIDFPSISVGWIVAQKNSKYQRNRIEVATVFRTADAGRNWVLVYEEKGVNIKDVFSQGVSNLFIVGARLHTQSLVDDEPMGLWTSDGGKTWEDLGKLITARLENTRTETSFIKLVSFDRTIIGIVTFEKNLLLFPSGEKKGFRNTSIRDPFPHYSFSPRTAGINDKKRLWILTGFKSSKEGLSSSFYSEQVDGSFLRRDFSKPLILIDAVFTPHDAVFACGSSGSVKASNGVVLYSSGDLTSWHVLFESSYTNELSDLYERFPNIWAVGNNGSIIKLSRK